MAKQLNGPQNKEQLNLMIDVVKREVNLAQDLLNSYQEDLAQLELNSSISEKEKESKRIFLETAIKESKELLNIRQKQLKSIDPMKGGKKAGEAKKEVWNDVTLESKGMNAIIFEMAAANKEQKHNEALEKTKQERQARSEEFARKLSEEKDKKSFGEAIEQRPDFIDEADEWKLLKKSRTGNAFIFEDSQKAQYIYFPEIGETRKYENIGKKTLQTYYDKNSNTWNQIPDEALQNSKLHYNSYMGQWMPYDFIKREWEETNWKVPTYDKDGNLIFDENGNMVLQEVTENEYEKIINNGGRSDAAKAAFAERIKNNVIEQEDEAQSHNFQPQIHLNWFQKLKLWFMRLFNKNYQLPEGRNYGNNVSDFVKNQKEKAINGTKDLAEKVKSQGREVKRTIKGFSIPKVKQFFKDHKDKILALSAVAVASLALVIGINGQKEHNRQIIEQKAAEAQKEADLEAKRAQEEQQALAEAAKQQEQQANEQDKLIDHDAETLTSGTLEKQYIARGGLEYTADSTGRGTKGTLANDTVVEIFNRAIVKENEEGNREILLTSNGKTWEDYAKDTGKSIDEIKNMLKQDRTFEMAAIQIGGINHNIFNTYGWVKTADLDESSKGTENLKDFEITTGDNTKILQQLQEKENINRINQNTQEER